MLRLSKSIKLGVAVPSYGMGNQAAAALLYVNRCPLVDDIILHETALSALTLAHNQCWIWGLNQYEHQRITHLLILHADVCPLGPQWIEVLIEQMQQSEADVLSNFIAIKNHLGFTSTAIDTDYWFPQRLTLRQAKQLPVTWTHPKLLINTGLMLVDLAKFADKSICFATHDEVYRKSNGEWDTRFVPEDWDFSRQCHAQGLSVFVTRGVPIQHSGITFYNNAPAWGVEVDRENKPCLDEITVTNAQGETMQFDPMEESGPPTPTAGLRANGQQALVAK